MDSYQNVFVMRHGDRLDNFNRHWAATAARPWDPHVSQNGLVRAFQTGQRIRSQTGSPIHRVFVSPFFRCVHTASEVVADYSCPKESIPFTFYRILQVGIEYGLCEMMNSMAIWPEVSPIDGKFDFNISDLEAMFPDGMVDHNVDPIYKEGKDWKQHSRPSLKIQPSTKKTIVLICIQTASKVVAALSLSAPRDLPSIDKSKLVKVAIEYGLCEMMNSVAIWPEVSPKDENFDFNISDLEAMFPEGMVDHNVDPIYKEMPKWEETVEGCKERYVKVVKALADKYPTENLLLITHREGLETTFSTFFKDITVLEVEDCAYVQLRREVSSKDGDAETGEYEVAQSGIRFSHIPVTIPTPV
ncbi:unnamed protein product [Brassica oleracea]